MLPEHETKVSNLLVIGSGGAGLRAAIEARLAGLSVIVLGKSLWGAFLCFLITIATFLMTFFFFDYTLTAEQVIFLLIVIVFSSIAFGFLGGILELCL